MSTIRCQIARSSLKKGSERRKSGFRRIPPVESEEPEFGRKASSLSLPTISRIMQLSEQQKYRRFSEGSNRESKDDRNWVVELGDIAEKSGEGAGGKNNILFYFLETFVTLRSMIIS